MMKIQSPEGSNEAVKVNVFAPAESGRVRRSLQGIGESFHRNTDVQHVSTSPKNKKPPVSPRKKIKDFIDKDTVDQINVSSGTSKNVILDAETAMVYHHIKNMSLDDKAELLSQVMDEISINEEKSPRGSERKRSKKKKINTKKLDLLRRPPLPSDGAEGQGDGARTRTRKTKKPRSRTLSTGLLRSRVPQTPPDGGEGGDGVAVRTRKRGSTRPRSKARSTGALSGPRIIY